MYISLRLQTNETDENHLHVVTNKIGLKNKHHPRRAEGGGGLALTATGRLYLCENVSYLKHMMQEGPIKEFSCIR